MSDEKRINKKDICLALPFFLVLGVLTVASLIVPLRPTFSESEKRELTKFPAFSLSALVSGDYFDGITLWFSDTFPGREAWLDVSQHVSTFHGYSEVAIDGALTDSDEIPPVEEPAAPEPETPEPAAPAATEETTAEEVPEETTEPESEEWGGAQVR